MTQFVKSYHNWGYPRSIYPTKIVVRRLPSNFTLDSFIRYVSPIPDHNYFRFVEGSGDGPCSFARVYINFIHWDDLLLFKEKYDNYVFLDENGVEHPAVVEFAPFQGIPKHHFRKKDNRSGTIQFDKYYQDFLEKNARKATSAEKIEFDLAMKRENNVPLTPLLRYVNEKKHEKKQNEKNFVRNRAADNCMVFVNSRVRRNQKFKYRRPKFLSSLYNNS